MKIVMTMLFIVMMSLVGFSQKEMPKDSPCATQKETRYYLSLADPDLRAAVWRGQAFSQQPSQQRLRHVTAADKSDLPSRQHGAIIRRPFEPAQLATAGRGCYRVIDTVALIVFLGRSEPT